MLSLAKRLMFTSLFALVYLLVSSPIKRSPFDYMELRSELSASLDKSDKAHAWSKNYGPIVEDMLAWLESEIAKPDCVYREASSQIVSYASALFRSLKHGGNLPEAIIGSSMPMRHEWNDGKGINYLITLPDGYGDAERQFPLMIDLPGLGWLGKRLSYSPRMQNKESRSAISVIPINDSLKGWNLDELDRLLNHLQEALHVDPNRIYLLGHSLGGNCVWRWAKRHPDIFAAIAPCSAWGSVFELDSLIETPVLALHGARDLVIAPSLNMRSAYKLSRLGGNVEIRMLQNKGHHIFDLKQRISVFNWLLQHDRNFAETHGDASGARATQAG